MLVPTMSIEQMGCIIHYREDLIYELKCPVCWDNGDREKTLAEFKKGGRKMGVYKRKDSSYCGTTSLSMVANISTPIKIRNKRD